MKREDLFDVIGTAADTELLERSEQFEKSRNRGVIWLKWSALAACLCFLLLVGSSLPWESLVPGTAGTPSTSGPGGVSSQEVGEPSSSGLESSIPEAAQPPESAPEPPAIPTPPPADGTEGLPMLEGRYGRMGGMGYDAVMCYDVSENMGSNPWTEDAELETLPVYRNLAYSSSGYRVYLSEEQLLSLAEWSAYCLGTRVESTEFERIRKENLWPEEDRLTGGEAEGIFARTEAGDEIRAFGNGGQSIIFAQPKPLPDDYSFTHTDTVVERGEAQERAAGVTYLLNEYDDMLEQLSGLEGVRDFTVDYPHSYSYSGKLDVTFSAFQDSGTLEERILNYNFSKLTFFAAMYENAWKGIGLWSVLPSAQKLGDYPLISPETARALLLQGDYIASVPKDYIRDGTIYDEDIAGVTLVYRTEPPNQYYQPYYLFYVELPEELDVEGLKSFGRFYVPAVSGEYLSDFPSWNGSYK